MKKEILATLLAVGVLSGCTSLTHAEKSQLSMLKHNGITVDKPVGNFEKPASPLTAGLLNILPGVGNFYLSAGDGGDGDHVLYGLLNLLTWPISIIWGIPEAAIDAGTINEREMLYYYHYDKYGKAEMKKLNLDLSDI